MLIRFSFQIIFYLNFFVLIWSQASTALAESNSLKIGVIAPLTGGVAIWGESVRNAIEIANAESKDPAQLFFEDEESCFAASALTAYRSLTANKKIDILITSCLEGAQAIAPLAARSGLPLIISGRSSKDFQEKNSNSFSWLSLLDYEGEAVANLIQEKKWQRGTAMVWGGYFGVQFAEAIKNATKTFGKNFEYDILEVAQNSTPAGADVQRLLRINPEVVFLMLSEPAAAYVVKQLRAMRYEGKIVLQSSMLQTYDPEVRASFEGALQQKFLINEGEFLKLQKKLKEKQGEQVADDFVFSYDGFKILLEVANDCKNEKAISLKSCLDNNLMNEQWRVGVSGKFRYMKDGSTQRPMIFKKITKSGLE